MDPHLPDEVILAAMRFRAFTREAENKKEWEVKHAELLGLLESQLEQASVADNRAATALRTLITDLKDARFVSQKKSPKRWEGEYPILPDGNRILVRDEFKIAKADARTLTYPFEIKQVPATIQIGIGGGSDDSGDKGLYYLLVDPVGRVIKRGFSDTDEFVWEVHQGTRTGIWKLKIEDLDTKLDEKSSSGNRGVVEVMCKTG